jgi:hypothetical protein
MSLLARAIEQRWRIPEGMKKTIIQRLDEIITNQDAKDCDVVQAAKTFVCMEKQNQDDVLRTRAQDATLMIRLLEQRGKSAPTDPEYLDWKRRRLLEKAGQVGASEDPAPTSQLSAPASGASAPSEMSAASASVAGPAPKNGAKTSAKSAPLKAIVDQRRRFE